MSRGGHLHPVGRGRRDRLLSPLPTIATITVAAAAGWAGAVAGVPEPPVDRPGRLIGWWSGVDPAMGLFGLLRTALLIIAAVWSVAAAGTVAVRIATAVLRSGWHGVGGLPGVARLALGLSASGGALAGCSLTRPAAASTLAGSTSTVTMPPAPVLLGPDPGALDHTSAGPGRLPPSRPSTSPPLSSRPSPEPPLSSTPAGPVPSHPEPTRAGPVLRPAGAPPRQPAGPHPPPRTPATTPRSPDAAPSATNDTMRLPAPVANRRAPSPPQAAPSPSGTEPQDGRSRTWTVRPGDNFWSIAEAVLSQSGRRPSDSEVASYWRRMIAVNRAGLPRPGDPDLLFTGEVIAVPPLQGGPR